MRMLFLIIGKAASLDSFIYNHYNINYNYNIILVLFAVPRSKLDWLLSGSQPSSTPMGPLDRLSFAMTSVAYLFSSYLS